jgi:hypothetical protein
MATGEGISPEIAFKQAYGLYLLHGGTPEMFETFSVDDVQIMYSAYMATQTYNRRELLKDIVQIIEKMFKV